MRLFKIIVNWTPKIWFPLAIVSSNGVINFLERRHVFAHLDFGRFTHPNIQIISGFFAIAGALINWILISTLLFFGCRLFYDGKGVFRNFFGIIGMCHLVLLVATLGHFIFTLISFPPDPTTLELTALPPDLTKLEYNTTNSQESSETITKALTSLKLPTQLINIVGHVCFVLILVAVVQTFFEIRWFYALCNVYVSYAVYWTLSKVLWSGFLYVFMFVFQQFFFQPWQPNDPTLLP